MNTTDTPVLRTRGRPPKTEADQEGLKARIADATFLAFAEHGYHALKVEHVLEKAGISRPTFYKYFRGLEEPLGMAALKLHVDLVGRVGEALSYSGDVILNSINAFDAYVDWGRSLGQAIRPLYAEFYEASSPIARFRLHTVATLQKLIVAKVVSSGRPEPLPSQIELFVTGVEFLAFRYLLRTDGSEAAWAETKLSMMRLLIAT
ncbi:MAG TPA: TetR/AcrR family transcriptional regulator, partial [Fluviicoccus sp.]|nr:TetR/AcrR family transcriptional regulator [Fluviicoccus sp.]